MTTMTKMMMTITTAITKVTRNITATKTRTATKIGIAIGIRTVTKMGTAIRIVIAIEIKTRTKIVTASGTSITTEIALATARERAIDLRRGVASGINPIEAKRRERELSQSRTFGALAERYLNEHARRFKRSAAADERNLRLHILPKWAHRRSTRSRERSS